MDRLTLRLLTKPRRQRGEIHLSVETAILSLILITLLVASVNLVRLGQTRNDLYTAAHAAARDVSLLRTAAAADTTAQDAAHLSLGTSGNQCNSLAVTVDSTGLTAPLGHTGIVEVTVSCTLPLAPGIVDWIPAAVTITRTATSPVDPYRERP